MKNNLLNSCSKLALITCITLSLAACGSTGSSQSSNISVSPKTTAPLSGILAQEDNDLGYSASDLRRIENAYKANPKDPKAAISYARILREYDYLSRAAIVLRPLAQGANATPAVKTEYAAIALASGSYAEAEQYAFEAIEQEPENYDAYHYLGIARDAQGDHIGAEDAFRKGLDHWKGDATPIMNNLALNLASQSYFTEAVALLEKAVSISPNRTELIRNLRIVNTLKETSKEKQRPEEG